MSSINHATKLAFGLATALLLMAPVAATPAAAQINFGFSIGGREPPPPRREERRPPPPREGFVWREGHYGYRDGAYVWIDGDWIEPPYTASTWVQGHWVERNGRHIWIEGHWEG